MQTALLKIRTQSSGSISSDGNQFMSLNITLFLKVFVHGKHTRVVVYVDCDIIESEFEFQSRY